MKASEFIKALQKIATEYKTLYVLGCFGWPMNSKYKARCIKEQSYNRQEARTKMINAASADTFGFDCVCLIKAVLWGWKGDPNATYGGAKYKANGVPDIGADDIIKVCSGVSTDFRNIIPGELLWTKGHVGVYIGDGLAVECTPAWKNKVQITAVKNIGTKTGYNARTWTKHGKLPYVEYDLSTSSNTAGTPSSEPQDQMDVVDALITGMRKEGYTNQEIYQIACAMKNVSYDAYISDMAVRVLNGEYGNGSERKTRLTAEGHPYALIQQRVNTLSK